MRAQFYCGWGWYITTTTCACAVHKRDIMCGIFACLCNTTGQDGKGFIKVINTEKQPIPLSFILLQDVVLGRLQRRGPDCLHEVCLPVGGGRLQLELLGTLLRMRGELTPLPLGNEAGDWLLWNGNVFGGDIQVTIHAKCNDPC